MIWVTRDHSNNYTERIIICIPNSAKLLTIIEDSNGNIWYKAYLCIIYRFSYLQLNLQWFNSWFHLTVFPNEKHLVTGCLLTHCTPFMEDIELNFGSYVFLSLLVTSFFFTLTLLYLSLSLSLIPVMLAMVPSFWVIFLTTTLTRNIIPATVNVYYSRVQGNTFTILVCCWHKVTYYLS